MEVVTAQPKCRRLMLALACTGLALAGPSVAQPTTSFELTGVVDRPGTHALPDLQPLPARTEAVTFQTGRGPVSASFTGPTLWSVLGSAGLTPMPGARNSSLRNVVVATGSDGYAAAFRRRARPTLRRREQAEPRRLCPGRPIARRGRVRAHRRARRSRGRALREQPGQPAGARRDRSARAGQPRAAAAGVGRASHPSASSPKRRDEDRFKRNHGISPAWSSPG